MYVKSFPSSRKLSLLLVTLFFVLFITSCTSSPPNPHTTSTQQVTPTQQVTRTSSSGLAIRVSGNQLINNKGQAIRLDGVNFAAGVECVGAGHTTPSVFQAPSTTQTASAMANWHVTGVRITLNEDCWLGINGANPAYAGSNYQNTVINFVKLLHSYGIYAIIDLHINAPGTILSTAQQVMADADHATTYWQSVATVFKTDPAVIFDAYNEPAITPANAQTTNPWQCWRDGCTVTVVYGNGKQIIATTPWQGLGMQGLVNAIRSTGATNPIMLGGLNFSENLTQFLNYLPTDPQHQLIASYHNYLAPGSRNTPGYWNRVIAPIAQQMPVVTGEFGEKDCQTSLVSQYMNWADAHNISYLAWNWWTPTGCTALGLLSDWNGTPSAYGQAFYDHFHSINPVSSVIPPFIA